MTNSVRAELNAVLSDSRTRLLLKPRLILANHKEGSLNVTRDEPILNTFYSDTANQASAYRTSSQSTVSSGLIIHLTPAISNRGLVEIDLEFENTVPIIVADIGNGTRGVGTSGERAKTTLIIADGQTRAIGGLISRDLTNGSAGLPFFSQIPYLGFLFGSKTSNSTLRNLMFFVTPTILAPEPTSDLIVEPVNAPARASMLEEEGAVVPPEKINEIPEELRPYLEQIRPQAIPYLRENRTTTPTVTLHPTTATLNLTPLTSATLNLERPTTATLNLTPPTSGTLTLSQQKQAGQALLSNTPYLPQQGEGTADIVKVGGAEVSKRGRLGPSGTFGGASSAAATKPRPAARPAASRTSTSTGKGGTKPSPSSRRPQQRGSLAPTLSNETRF
jgi:hypothetical protein